MEPKDQSNEQFYAIVRAGSLSNLESLVNAALRNGVWKPLGGPFVFPNKRVTSPPAQWFGQALVRKDVG